MILTLDDVNISYDGVPVLEHVSFCVPRNCITAIIGPSGCGKSTLLRCINGLIREENGVKFSGSIALNGESVNQIPADKLRRKIGLVFQTPSPFPFSIYKNMTYASRYFGLRDKRALDTIVVEKLRMVGLYDEVKDCLNKSALKLSGGQKQRLCIARALTVEPEVLLLDEPCSALDVKSSAAVERLLTELKKNYTIVIVTHNLAQAKRIADHTVFLYNGRIVEQGPAEELFSNPKEEETKEFLGGIFG